MAIAIIIDGPDVPAGFKGNINALLNFLRENWSGQVNVGEGILPGQIGGATPTSNIGLFVSGTRILVWDDTAAKYVAAGEIPVGSVIAFAGNSEPANYLICDGRTLQSTDPQYEQLFAAIGYTWSPGGVAVSTTGFNIPNLQGRCVVGAGTGDYSLNNDVSVKGKITFRAIATYFGFEWLLPKVTKQTGSLGSAPANVAQVASSVIAYNARNTFTGDSQPSAVCNYLIKYQ